MNAAFKFDEAFQPIPLDRQDLIIDQAKEMSFIHELSIAIYLFTGLERIDGCHIQKKMITETDKGIQIQLLPGDHECRAGGRSNKRPEWGDGKACQHCQDTEGKYSFSQPRPIPVRDEWAAEVIAQWFQVYDSTPNEGTMAEYIKQVGAEAGIPRLTPSVLRHSFGVRLAEAGFTQNEIASLLDFADSTIEAGYLRYRYGEFCDGGNPYFCKAATSSGGQCSRISEPGLYCEHHRPDSGCVAVLEDGEPCGGRALDNSDFCLHHENMSRRCGKQSDGSTCDSIVWNSEEYCTFHRESQPTCGAETRFHAKYKVCRRPVQDEELRCPIHTGYRCGETDIQREGPCRRSVRSPDESCVYHSDSEHTCGATDCQRPVRQPESRCYFHKELNPTCGVENYYGEPCARVVSSPGERCVYHSDNVEICGAELSSGKRCGQRVGSESERCKHHNNSQKFICGKERTRGRGKCMQIVSAPDEYCHYHN